MNIVIKQPNKQILDLDILKQHLRIDHDHENAYLREVISMATDILEKNIEYPILKKIYRYICHIDEYNYTHQISIPMNHVSSVISVKKIINEKEKEDVKYTVGNNRNKTYIITNWTKYPIEITYSAGITDNVDEIPKDLQFAVLQIAKNIYECAEEDVLESKYIKHIINSNRTLYIN